MHPRFGQMGLPKGEAGFILRTVILATGEINLAWPDDFKSYPRIVKSDWGKSR